MYWRKFELCQNIKSKIHANHCFLRVVALPLSRKLGVFDRVQVRVPPNPKLEAFYMQRKKHFTQVSGE